MVPVGLAVRAFLNPLWERLHQVDLDWHRIAALPDARSTALCRHTVLFSLRLFERAHMDGWCPASGHIHTSAMLLVPSYAKEEISARHCWMRHASGLWLDLTADQFGLPDVLWSEPASDAFSGHVEVSEKAPLRALLRTIYNWEGDPRGTWPADDLAQQRTRYAQLMTGLAAS